MGNVSMLFEFGVLLAVRLQRQRLCTMCCRTALEYRQSLPVCVLFSFRAKCLVLCRAWIMLSFHFSFVTHSPRALHNNRRPFHSQQTVPVWEWLDWRGIPGEWIATQRSTTAENFFVNEKWVESRVEWLKTLKIRFWWCRENATDDEWQRFFQRDSN